MRCFRLVPWTFIAVLACNRASAESWEITPFGGYQFGGDFTDVDTGIDYDLDEDFAYGLMLDIDLDELQQVEVYFSVQETSLSADGETRLADVDVGYLHVGGTVLWDEGAVKPFVVGTMGLTHFDPDPVGSGSKTRFSMALGGGVKVMATENIGFRFEGRGFATFVDSSTSIYCGPGCTVYFDSNVFTQFQVSAGVVFRF